MPPHLHFELVAPEKLLVSKDVAMVTVPGGEGDYGVLAGHAPLITTVRPGVIDVYEQSDTSVSERIFVAGGFAEVTGERCTVLAEEAIPITQLNRVHIDEEMRALRVQLAESKSDAERHALEHRIALTTAKLQAMAA